MKPESIAAAIIALPPSEIAETLRLLSEHAHTQASVLDRAGDNRSQEYGFLGMHTRSAAATIAKAPDTRRKR